MVVLIMTVAELLVIHNCKFLLRFRAPCKFSKRTFTAKIV